MYAVCARGCRARRLIEAPLIDTPDGWTTDLEAMRDLAIAPRARKSCSCVARQSHRRIDSARGGARMAQSLQGRARAGGGRPGLHQIGRCAVGGHAHRRIPEYRGPPHALKLHALAGARIGCVLADPALIAVLRRCQAPYPVPQPCAELALRTASWNRPRSRKRPRGSKRSAQNANGCWTYCRD